MVHPKKCPNWWKEVMSWPGHYSLESEDLLQSWIENWGIIVIFSILKFRWEKLICVFISYVKREWKNMQLNFSIQNFNTEHKYVSLHSRFNSSFSTLCRKKINVCNYFWNIFMRKQKKASFRVRFLFWFCNIPFVGSILFPNNKLHQGLLQRKIDPIGFMLGSCQTVFFNIKSNGRLLIFQFLADCSNIRWFSGWK